MMPTDANDTSASNRRILIEKDRSPSSAKRQCAGKGIVTKLDRYIEPLSLSQQQLLEESIEWSDFVNPQELQQQFLQRLHGETKEAPQQVSDDIPLPFVQPPLSNKDDPSLRSSDSSMFGDDIPLDVLEMIPDVTSIPPPSKAPQTSLNYDDDDDMFGDDIPLELLEDSQLDRMPTTDIKADLSSSSNNTTEPKRYKRYTVVYTQMKQYEQGSSQFPEKELLLVDQNHENQAARAYLRQDWLNSNVKEGDTVNICFSPGVDQQQPWIIDNDTNYIVQHPDHLISCTSVAESFFCLRKSVLSMTTKGVNDFNEILVHGSIIHETLQYCLLHGDFTTLTLQTTLQRILLAHLDELYTIQQDEKTAFDLLKTYIKSIQVFGAIYVGNTPKAAATIKTDNGPTDSSVSSVAIRRILDIEEHIWSPAFGLKGMIDATVEMVLAPGKKVLTLPFELKTGKSSRSVSHRAQTMLYTLLLAERYDADIDTGVLYYSKTNSLYLVPTLRAEMRGLIIARNELAVAFHHKSIRLPPMVKDLHSCQYCALSTACVVYHKAVENGSGSTSGLGQWFEDSTAHINDEAAAFYRHWSRLIAMEEKDLDVLRKDIWCESADKCERSGKCLKNMVVVKHNPANHWYTFQRHPDDTDYHSLAHTNLIVGDTLVISSMTGDLLLGSGLVAYIDSDTIMVSIGREIRSPPTKDPDFSDFYQVFKKEYNPETKYRLDKDEAAGGFALMKNNLVGLMTHNVSKPTEFDTIHAKLRRLIVQAEPPAFMALDQSPMAQTLSDPAYSHLNSDQIAAIQKVVTCQDYALILGMPGTGKTTTTAHLIRFLIHHGKSVLLTAYTHNALDNILVKLVDDGVDILRLGNVERVMPRLRGYLPEATVGLDSVDAMTRFYDSKLVVGATCYGTNHIIFQRRRFDYCIVDEASQITLPVCVGPLQYADRFVLVGDQYQLPPIIKDAHANEAGLSTSLFATLARSHPEAIAYLQYQYRMHKDIMTLSSQLVYDNKLKCGSDTVATRTLQYPHLDQGLASLHSSSNNTCRHPCWLKDILDPSRAVVFVDTDALPAKETQPGIRVIQNEGESALVYQTAEALLQCGLRQDQIAIISVYRTQLRLISQHFGGTRPDLEVATIDKYQGRDKDCVLISLVRSNDKGHTGILLKDWRRLNVAFTRAKCKLVLFGSSSTLHQSTMFHRFLSLIEENQWVYRLEKDALEMHDLPYKDRKTTGHKTFTAPRKDRPLLNDIINYIAQG